MVEKLSKELASIKTALIIDYQGLSAPNLNNLRETIAKHNNRLQAVKKNLLRISLEKAEIKELSQGELPGQTAVVMIREKPIETIKAISTFAKEHDKPQFLAGLFDGKIINQEEFNTLTSIASREVLLSQTAALVKNPITRLILQTKVNQQRLISVLNAITRR